jgi:hypothetical protein
MAARDPFGTPTRTMSSAKTISRDDWEKSPYDKTMDKEGAAKLGVSTKSFEGSPQDRDLDQVDAGGLAMPAGRF